MKKGIITFLKGLIIGTTMTVPGVSGGSMAMILGIYDKMINAVTKALKFDKKSICFLLVCVIGAGLGMVLFSNYILELIERFPMPTRYFFIGAVAGGMPMIYKCAGVKKFSPKTVIYPILGIVIVSLIALLPAGIFAPSETFSIGGFLIQILGGVIIAIALVLPGISVSQMLLMLGLYEIVMKSIATLSILPLIPLAVGVIAGTIATAKAMDKCIEKYPLATYLIIFGFVLGSLRELFPRVPTGWEIPLCIVTAVAGFFALYYVSKKAEG